MLATDTQFLDVLLPAAIRLHETVVAEYYLSSMQHG